jgi:uncharacterized alpha-E superfamily protein
MLSRTAAHLYWLGRYMERAENLSRVLEVGYRMSQMPALEGDGNRNEWQSSAVAAACAEGLAEKYGEANLNTAIAYIVLDQHNPSSLLSGRRTAPTNGRAVPTALTTEMWESLNDTWLQFNGQWRRGLGSDNLSNFLDWVKDRTTLFRGATHGTMLHDEPFSFFNIGIFLERADNTARILDVKYHILLPSGEGIGGSVDYYQWATILRSVSALGSYHWVYRDSIKPWNVAELMILRPEMPRSLAYSVSQVAHYLGEIAGEHGQKYDCNRLAGKLHAELGYAKIEDIFQNGLHEYLSAFLERNNALGAEIAENFHFYL